MRRTTMVFCTLLLLVGLTGCDIPQVYKGMVIAKEHHEAYTNTILMPMVVGKVTIMMPMTQYYPEEWTIRIKGTDTSGEKRVVSFNVTGWAEYEMYEVGQEVANPDAHD